MSDVAVRWVAVAPSAWRRRLRCAAVALSAGVLVSLVAVRATGSALAAVGAGAVAALFAAWAAGRRVDHPDPREWRIGTDGCVEVRSGDEICRDAAAVFVSPAFIVLRTRRRTLEIWRDATPIEAFRRLSVAVRWRARRTDGATLSAINPTDAAERT